jgi:hypothetical protein
MDWYTNMFCRTQKKLALIALAFSYFQFFSLQAQAFEIITNGFGTVCASKSDVSKTAFVNVPVYSEFAAQWNNTTYVAPTFYRPTYVGADRRWNLLPDSKFALQFTSIFDDKFKAVAQVIGRWETFTYEHYYAKMDWAYLQYNRNNQLDIQLGRYRIPSFYFSDYLDVNNAQPWVMPPDEVYFIVGGAFRNMDGIKARYSDYIGNFNLTGQLYYGTMEEDIYVLFGGIHVSVRDTFGVTGQIEHDRFSLRGSLMRSVYDTNLYGNLEGIASGVNAIMGSTPQSRNLLNTMMDKDQSIIYVGLAASLNITDNLNLLFERASILSPGIISTARVGWYGSLTYNMGKFAITGTHGFSRPLGTESKKYEVVRDFFQTSQYLTAADNNSGAGKAVTEAFKSYLGRQRSYAVDVRYDVLPSVALKAGVKCVKPLDKSAVKYILNRLPVYKSIMVYRVSMDFVF